MTCWPPSWPFSDFLIFRDIHFTPKPSRANSGHQLNIFCRFRICSKCLNLVYYHDCSVPDCPKWASVIGSRRDTPSSCQRASPTTRLKLNPYYPCSQKHVQELSRCCPPLFCSDLSALSRAFCFFFFFFAAACV
jgi:hypothetical protein